MFHACPIGHTPFCGLTGSKARIGSCSYPLYCGMADRERDGERRMTDAVQLTEADPGRLHTLVGSGRAPARLPAPIRRADRAGPARRLLRRSRSIRPS